jgi:hypothetical protein
LKDKLDAHDFATRHGKFTVQDGYVLDAKAREQAKAFPGNRRDGGSGAADDRQVIVAFVRAAFAEHHLSEEVAVRVLAEAGESLDWQDSVPDRLILHERVVPIPGTPTEKRRFLAYHFPVLGDCMAYQNRKMCERLAELQPDLTAAFQRKLAESRTRRSPGDDRSPGR